MAKKWRLDNSGLGVVEITLRVMDQLSSYRQCSLNDKEAGGTLLGRLQTSEAQILIDDFTAPQPKDRRERSSYYRSKDHDQLVKKAWRDSNGFVSFFGLWHTHPEAVPAPSKTDLADWENSLRKSSYAGDHQVFMILGQRSLRVWLGELSGRNTRIKLLGTYSFGDKYLGKI